MANTEFDYDIFISYAHFDNETLTKDQEGWIAMLHRALNIRLAQLLGEKPRIWRDPKLGGNDYLDDTIIEELIKAAILVSVLSPRYVKSEWCAKEIETFMKAAQQTIGLRVDGKCRIFKVIKTHIPLEEQPPETRGLLGYEFYEIDPETGRTHEFMGFGGDPAPEYWQKLEDLAQDIRELLYILREKPVSSPSGVSVYLAETTSDLKAERDQIRRELQARGYNVLPDRPLSINASELEPAVRGYLERCSLSVHLVGENYGFVPEAADRSIIELQNDLAIERGRYEPGFSRLVWMPVGLKPEDERQEEFVTDLKDDPILQPGDDLLQVTLEELKTVIQDKLKASKKDEEAIKPELTYIYLICDQQDMDAVAPLQDYLFQQGFEPLLPLFEGDESDVREEHQESLRICHGTIIYYGHASEAWLRAKIRDLRKAPGYGRSAPIRASAIYIAGPETPQKERFRTHEVDYVIRNYREFSPEHLGPFLSKFPGMKEGGNNG